MHYSAYAGIFNDLSDIFFKKIMRDNFPGDYSCGTNSDKHNSGMTMIRGTISMGQLGLISVMVAMLVL